MKKLFLLALAFCSLTAFAQGQSYCNYHDAAMVAGGAEVTLSVSTAANGDVLFTIGDGLGATNTSWRNGGLEGGMNGFKVLSGAGFATEEPAADYFTRDGGFGDADLVITLKLKSDVTLPSPCIIHFSTEAFSWKNDQEGGAWTKAVVVDYLYNSPACSQLAAPQNVAITADGVITFDAVTGANQYVASVYYNGVFKSSQTVTSGETLVYTPLVSGTYQVKVVAKGYDVLNSVESSPVDWALTAEEVVVGPSEYCEEVFLAGDVRAAAFTWETMSDGSVVITIEDATDAAEKNGEFRGNGISLNRFKVGTVAASTYFTHSVSPDNKQVILTLISADNAPAFGEKITVNDVIEYKTALDGNAWPTLQFNYTYGSRCGSTPTAIENVAAVKVLKTIENGQIVIIKNGVRYNAQGARL